MISLFRANLDNGQKVLKALSHRSVWCQTCVSHQPMPSDVHSAILKSWGQGGTTWYWLSLLVLSLMNKQVVWVLLVWFYLVCYGGIWYMDMPKSWGCFFLPGVPRGFEQKFSQKCSIFFFLKNSIVLKTSTEAHRGRKIAEEVRVPAELSCEFSKCILQLYLG